MDEERRRHRRLPLKLSILCRKVGIAGGEVVTGKTVDVSPGGMLVQVNNDNVDKGDLLSIEMSVPPTEGLLDFGGSLSNHARVVRSGNHRSPDESDKKVIALEFCDSPQLRT
jgi:hypothetical protein